MIHWLKPTDTHAFTNSGILLSAVYIVNPQGVLKNEGMGEGKSYEEQVQNIDTLYPSLEYLQNKKVTFPFCFFKIIKVSVL